MINTTQQEYLLQLANYLPNRRPGKRGPIPIDKSVIINELYRLFKTNCGWRNIQHSTTCRKYLVEIQRRGLLKKFLKNLTKDLWITRPTKTIIDTSDIISFRVRPAVKYSGKYHNYCQKISLLVNTDLVPLAGDLHSGSASDSKIFDDMLSRLDKLPYEILADKGFERYERRRELARQNCQLRIEMKRTSKSRKKGRRFSFTKSDKSLRGSIEKVVAWLKSFAVYASNRFRIKSILKAMFLFSIAYIAFMRLKKL